MSLPDFTNPTLTITAWVDPVIDALGHDARSTYVETFWLSVLGPSTTWLVRRLAAGLDLHPDGYDLPLAETAKALGLGTKGGRNSPFVRSLSRCCQFGVATCAGSDGLAVRRKLPPLTRHQVERLPPELQQAHRDWQAAELRTPTTDQQRRRARSLALSLVELGEGLEGAENQLHRWRFHPAMAREAALWARDRHREAESALRNAGDTAPTGSADLGGDAA
ncbi:MAG: hypothetical protein WKF43_10335 [Acidimicrobiales bacterium]